jgi:FAD:protein FMN transferase
MACRFEVLLDGEDSRYLTAASDALDEAARLEAALTVYRETSDLVRLNQRAGDAAVIVDHELFALLTRCQVLHDETDGTFDITATPLSRCWGFFVRHGRLPAPDAIEEARRRVGMPHVQLDAATRSVRFRRDGLELNLGAIGKGFAVDCVAARLRAAGVRHALVSAATSSVVAVGGRRGGWTIDLTSRRAARPLARLRLRDGALGTSGAGEQYVEVDGVRHGHVIDPRTGWSARGILSSTVVAPDAASADALATAFLVGGLALARRYCDTHPDILAILTPEGSETRPVIIGGFEGATLEDA